MISSGVQLIGICSDLTRLTFPAHRQVLIPPAHLQTRLIGAVIELPHKAEPAAREAAVPMVTVPPPAAWGPRQHQRPFRTAAWVQLRVAPAPGDRLAGTREEGGSDRADVARCAARRSSRAGKWRFRAWWW
ncbi:MAG: hypothetical protein QOI10_3908 [Solirubrobacterales bacterium]|nr:hypothetical protein [Solirubrobacterales bacterium]